LILFCARKTQTTNTNNKTTTMAKLRQCAWFVVTVVGLCNCAFSLLILLQLGIPATAQRTNNPPISLYLTNWGVFTAMVHFLVSLVWPAISSTKGKAPPTYHIALCANFFVTIMFWPLWFHCKTNLVSDPEVAAHFPMWLCTMQHLVPFALLSIQPLLGSACSCGFSSGIFTDLCTTLVYHLCYSAAMLAWFLVYGVFPYPFLDAVWNYGLAHPPRFVVLVSGAITLVLAISIVSTWWANWVNPPPKHKSR